MSNLQQNDFNHENDTDGHNEAENNLDSLEYDDDINSLSTSNANLNHVGVESPTKPTTYDHNTPTTIHSITDVYEIAAAIGNTMEGLISEFGQEKMQNLTKEIVRCLENFEKTVNSLTKETENSLEYQYNLEKSKHEVSQLKSRHEGEIKNLDNTIDQLQATIETLQISNDALLENFDWDDMINSGTNSGNEGGPGGTLSENDSISRPSTGKATQTELQLAKKLRLQTEKYNRLEGAITEQISESQYLSEKVRVYSEHFPDFKIDDFVAPLQLGSLRHSLSSLNESFNTENSSNPGTPRHG